MKPIIYLLLSCFSLLFFSNTAQGAVMVKPVFDQKVIKKNSKDAMPQGLSSKKQRKYKKRINRLNKRIKKRALKKNKRSTFANSVLDDSKFRLGLLVFAAGIALILLTVILFGGGIIAWVARLATLIGLVLMIWAAIEYF